MIAMRKWLRMAIMCLCALPHAADGASLTVDTHRVRTSQQTVALAHQRHTLCLVAFRRATDARRKCASTASPCDSCWDGVHVLHSPDRHGAVPRTLRMRAGFHRDAGWQVQEGEMRTASISSRRRLLGIVAMVSTTAFACGELTPTAPDVADAGMKLRIVSGEAQSGLVGTELPQPLVVQALTSAGVALAGQIVNFRVVEGGGSVFAGASITDANGYAREWWTLGPLAGRNRIEARAVHPTTGERLVFAEFTAEGVTTLPPPPSEPHPPAGTVVFTDGFESGTLDLWQDGVDPTRHRVVTDSSRARSGSRFLEITYPRTTEGGGGWLTRFFMPGYDSLRVSYWVRFPTNWQGGTYLLGIYGSRTDNQWSSFGKAGQCPNGTDFTNHFLYAEYDGNPGDVTFYSYTMDMDRSAGCYGDRGAGRAQYVGSRELTRGAWHRVDLEVRLNTPGLADGWQRMYIDGTLRGEWTGMQQRASTMLRLNALQLTANVPGGSPQDQALLIDDIVVTTLESAEPPPSGAAVSSVTISPTSASTTVGGRTTLTATARDANGTILTGRTTSWTSSNASVASVDGAGTVTGVSAGTATITASVEGSTGTAAVAVTALSGGGTVRFANEPAGMTRVTDWSFPTLTGSGWTYQPEASFARIIQDASAPTDPSVVEFVYPVGFPGGSAPGRVAAPRFKSGARELYWAFTWKANASWQGHSSTINKIGYGWQNGRTLFGLTWYWHDGTASPSISLFDQGSNLRYFRPNTPHAAPVRAGEWHEVEVYYRPSSATGRADGIVKVWVNGVLMNNHINVVTTAGTLNDVYFEPTWGGVGDRKSAEDHFRFGQARISVR